MTHIESGNKATSITRKIFENMETRHNKGLDIVIDLGGLKYISIDVTKNMKGMNASDLCDLVYKYSKIKKAYKREEGKTLHVLFFFDSKDELEYALNELGG